MVFYKGSPGRKTLFTGVFLAGSWTVIALLALCLLPEPFLRLDYRLYDVKLAVRSGPPLGPEIVHVDIDDQAVDALGPWPWDRRMSARLLKRLGQLGAKAVVFDILYSTSKRSEGDQDLFKAISESTNTVSPIAPIAIDLAAGPMQVSGDHSRVEALYERLWGLNVPSDSNLYHVSELRDSSLPLLPVIKGSRYLGHIKSTADSDGVHRRIPLFLKVRDRLMPSLSVAGLAAYWNLEPDAFSVTADGHVMVQLKDRTMTIPVNERAEILINWKTVSDHPNEYSVLDLFTDEEDTSRALRYKDKIVVVGVAWTGTSDIGATPLESQVLLSRLHSSVMDTIISGQFIREVPFFPYPIAGTIVLLIFFVWVAAHGGLKHGVMTLAGMVAFMAAAVAAGFFIGSLQIPLVQPLVLILPAGGIVLLFRSLANDKEAELIRSTFGEYLSENVVTEILKCPSGIQLKGEMREITVLVSDLRGFTPMTEHLPPLTTFQVINIYFECMTEIIMRHEGTINEIMGDGIIVFFGAPQNQPDHWQRAVQCALEMQSAIPGLNAANIALGLPELAMGIGINTGVAVLGTIGSSRRKKYAALGSPVNIAFRVEAQTTAGQILVTSEIYKRNVDHLEVDGVREVRLKGIKEPMVIYNVIGWKDGVTALQSMDKPLPR